MVHILPDGSDETRRTVAFALRTLNKCKRNNAQVKKEALRLIFGVKKFHNFLFGRRFKFVTNHRPLTLLLGPNKAIPTLSSARIQRRTLILLAYQYDVVCKKGGYIKRGYTQHLIF